MVKLLASPACGVASMKMMSPPHRRPHPKPHRHSPGLLDAFRHFLFPCGNLGNAQEFPDDFWSHHHLFRFCLQRCVAPCLRVIVAI